MTEFLIEYGLFFAKSITVVIAIGFILILISALSEKTKSRPKEHLEIKKINQKYEDMADLINNEVCSKAERKIYLKEKKKSIKSEKDKEKKRLFVLNFEGDIKASAVANFREEITAVLTVVKPSDEVFIRLNSSGGMVHTYGLAASQMLRIKQRNILITVSVDKVAASGGYLMACVANTIIAAPFAILGSIGVVAQLPNFNRLLKKNHVDYELFTAGEYKRTVTMFGENTDNARAKFREELDDTHNLFKEFVSEHRPNVDIKKVSTGEHWYGLRALEKNLVDEVKTSDDYLLDKHTTTDIYEVIYSIKKGIGTKLTSFVQDTVSNAFSSNKIP